MGIITPCANLTRLVPATTRTRRKTWHAAWRSWRATSPPSRERPTPGLSDPNYYALKHMLETAHAAVEAAAAEARRRVRLNNEAQ